METLDQGCGYDLFMELAEIADCWVDTPEVVQVDDGHEAPGHLLGPRRGEGPYCQASMEMVLSPSSRITVWKPTKSFAGLQKLLADTAKCG